MKHLFRLLIAPVALAALFSAGRFAFADETAAERLARLNAERIVWLDGVTYYAKYTFSRGTASSQSAGMEMNFQESDVAASGFFCKSDDKCRLQILYRTRKNSPLSDSASDAGRAAEMLANDNYAVTYVPPSAGGRSSGGTLSRVSDKSLCGITQSLQAIKSPMALFVPPIDSLPDATFADSDYEYEETGDGHARLTFYGTNPKYGSRYIKEVLLQVDAVPATIEMTDTSIYSEEGGELLTRHVLQGFDWTECGGFRIPSRVRMVTGLFDPDKKSIRSWIVSEWKSSGINNVTPVQKDLLFRLEPGVELEGLNRPAGSGAIDIDAIADEDLVSEGTEPETPTAVQEEAPRNRNRAWAAAAVLLLAGGGGLVYRILRRKRAKAPKAPEDGGGAAS